VLDVVSFIEQYAGLLLNQMDIIVLKVLLVKITTQTCHGAFPSVLMTYFTSCLLVPESSGKWEV
jgi:hypothetical protein